MRLRLDGVSYGMPKRSSKKRTSRRKKRAKPADENQIAVSIVQQVAEDGETMLELDPPKTADGKNAAAVALGRLGGRKGGPARAARLSAEQRQEIARKAAQARWKGKGRQDD